MSKKHSDQKPTNKTANANVAPASESRPDPRQFHNPNDRMCDCYECHDARERRG
jgi:hypothetical protein